LIDENSKIVPTIYTCLGKVCNERILCNNVGIMNEDIMTADEIRQKFLQFFKDRGHAVIPSASLIPENDPTTLFTASGMQPMLPYLLGQEHPAGTRVADSQKSFRTVDINEVGDNRHTTFFEMLGNWSLGDYFKKEQIEWMFQFLTDEIKIDPNRLYVTVFTGDKKNNIPKDTEAAGIWKELFAKKGINAKEIEIGGEENGYKVGMQGGRIFYYDVKKNWWSRAGTPDNMPAGEPGGSDSEMFYEFTDIEHDKKFGELCHPNCDCGRFLEIGNNVFMQYKKNSDGTFSMLPKHNVDFGGGLERMIMAVQNCHDIFEVNHKSILSHIEKVSGKKYGQNCDDLKAFRIIADHMKASVFLIADGVIPGNTDRGYFVRRLIRRSVRYADLLGIKVNTLAYVVEPITNMYKDCYPEVHNQLERIIDIVIKEEMAFRKTLMNGLKEFEKVIKKGNFGSGSGEYVSSDAVFNLVTTYGFPVELVQEISEEKGLSIDLETFQMKMDLHKARSRSGSEQKFKGGLGGTGEMETKYHTATHLLRQALEDVLGEKIVQKGSNINAERLRFDFGFDRKMTDDEKRKVEKIVNEKILAGFPVQRVVMKKEEAEKTGAVHAFGDKYADEVSVYFVGDSLETAYSKEFCGGPHVENTNLLGRFKITKEEAVSAGVRRIKAVLES